MVNAFEGLDHLFVIGLINVGNHVTDGLVSLQILTQNIDIMVGKEAIDLCQDSGYIMVKMYKSMGIFPGRQLEVGEVYTASRTSGIYIFDDLFRHKIGRASCRERV